MALEDVAARKRIFAQMTLIGPLAGVYGMLANAYDDGI